MHQVAQLMGWLSTYINTNENIFFIFYCAYCGMEYSGTAVECSTKDSEVPGLSHTRSKLREYDQEMPQ